MKLKESIPFLNGNESGNDRQDGRVRLLGKVEKVDPFEVSDFNKLIKTAAAKLKARMDKGSVFLGDEINHEVDKEDLLDQHLSYQVKVTEEESSFLKESTTLKIILVVFRVQPHRAIEINGPQNISLRYKEALEDAFTDRFGEDVEFQDLVKD